MARRKSPKGRKIQKATRQLTYLMGGGDQYVDIAQSLSIVNRKLFKQGMCYGIESVEFAWSQDPVAANAPDTITLTAMTAGDNWVVHNSHVKGQALWHEMNDLVLKDNPSVQGKWHDYKVYLDGQHFTSANLIPRDGGLVSYQQGEWIYSTYVMPQHEVDPVTGLPLDAPEVKAHLIGDDSGVPNPVTTVTIGLVKAYEESRATVFDNNPNVPGGFSTSFFSLLTDSGSQEPELADIIEFANDDPPYTLSNYPGGDTNAVNPIITEFGVASVGFPLGNLTPFVAQCGLIKFNVVASFEGNPISAPPLTVRINLMPGPYKGVAAIPMGQ